MMSTPLGRYLSWRSGLKVAVLLVVVAALVGWLQASPTQDVLGPWLATRSVWERAGIGVLVGAVLAAPMFLLLVRGLLRRFAWLFSAYMVTAWIYVSTAWLAPKSHLYASRPWACDRIPGAGCEAYRETVLFREQADVYLIASIIVFHVAALRVGYLAWRRRAGRRAGEQPGERV